jgi:tetratricopeptide (TPR) repeat protein
MSTGSPEQYEDMSRQVIETARRVGDPIALRDALYVRIRGDRRPESSEERLAAIDEILQLTDNVGETEFQAEILTFRLLENLERGDMKALSADWHTYRRLSEKFQRPLFTYGVWLFQVMMALFAGHFEKAEQLANEALITGRQIGVENIDGIHGIQIFTIRREQGRLREIAPIVKLFIEQHSSSAAWGPGLAIIYSELGLKSEALAEFESLAANDFSDLPQDALWVTCIAYLSEVCAYLGDVDRAVSLYQLLLPYNGRTIVAGFFSVCFGAVSRYLGILAATMCRWDDAETHFEEALELNTRIDARPWLAHTQYQFAIMLLSHGHTKDRARAMSLLNDALEIAQQLGMKSLVENVEAYRG